MPEPAAPTLRPADGQTDHSLRSEPVRGRLKPYVDLRWKTESAYRTRAVAATSNGGGRQDTDCGGRRRPTVRSLAGRAHPRMASGAREPKARTCANRAGRRLRAWRRGWPHPPIGARACNEASDSEDRLRVLC